MIEVTRQDLETALTELRTEIADPAGGIHGPESLSWRIGREAGLFLAAGRASLMQLSHPFVAQAVQDHSRTRSDVRGRFQRTFLHIYSMVFGDLDAAVRSARRVHAIHERVTGTLAESAGRFRAGTPYRANDAETLLWVHATLVDSSVRAYERIVRPLSDADRDLYLFESDRFARLFGIPRELLPTGWREFSRYVDGMSAELVPTRAAADLARFLMTPPTRLHLPLSLPYRAVTAALLPARLRAPFSLDASRAELAAAHAFVRAFRVTYRALPRRIRHVPAYVEASRRVRGQPPVDPIGRAIERALVRTLG